MIWIVSFRPSCNRADKTLAMTLYKQVTKLKEQKSDILLVRLFLGIRAMKVAFVLWLTTSLLWNSENTLIRSSKITSQHSWNTTIVKPLGPGALSLSTWKMAWWISSSIKAHSNLESFFTETGDQSKPSNLQDSLGGLAYGWLLFLSSTIWFILWKRNCTTIIYFIL